MRQERRVGRPRSASRDILEEAACELFLEKGYAATSVADITQRAGVSRATFFNYIPAKSDLLWTSVDDVLDALVGELRARGSGADDEGGAGSGRHDDSGADDAASAGAAGLESAVAETHTALLRVASRLEPGTVVLAFANAEPMGVAEELEESAARRQGYAGRIIAGHLRRRGVEALTAEVIGTAQAGAFLAALRAWSRSVPGRTNLSEVLARALDAVRPGTPVHRT